VFFVSGVSLLTRGGFTIERTRTPDVITSKKDGKEGVNPLAEQEKKVIEIMRGLDYGELHITIKNGSPVHVEEIRKSIKL